MSSWSSTPPGVAIARSWLHGKACSGGVQGAGYRAGGCADGVQGADGVPMRDCPRYEALATKLKHVEKLVVAKVCIACPPGGCFVPAPRGSHTPM